MGVRVAVVGSGGREHALATAIAKSPHVDLVYCIPGNGGTALTPKCQNVSGLKTNEDMAKFADENGMALTVVGPEDPLANGIVDLFESRRLFTFGPTQGAAQLEANKAYAKAFMAEHGVPTAEFQVFTDAASAHRYIDTRNRPLFVKASGLALGKGAIDGSTPEMAHEAVRRIMEDKEFGEAGASVVLEDFLQGEEVSAMALINSDTCLIVPLLPSQDHKRLQDGDKGPNTGGMGAYAPTSLVTPDVELEIDLKVLARTLAGIHSRGLRYTGALYPGLMVCDGQPFVLEYNIRFGDPETQPVLALLESDAYELLVGVTTMGTKPEELRWKPGYAVCVVAASGGYPGKYEKGKLITGLDKAAEVQGVTVYHAGTKLEDGKVYTNGGRVLGVTAIGETMGQACDRAYAAMDEIHFDGKQFRKDIGHRELARAIGR